jgi:hypothetical protein
LFSGHGDRGDVSEKRRHNVTSLHQ